MGFCSLSVQVQYDLANKGYVLEEHQTSKPTWQILATSSTFGFVCIVSIALYNRRGRRGGGGGADVRTAV
jgi:hypothetical protein